MDNLMEFPVWLNRLRTRLVSIRIQVWSLASLSGLRIWCCHKLWRGLQMRLGSGIAVWGLGLSCSFNSTPSLGTLICHRCGPKKKKKIISRLKQRGILRMYSMPGFSLSPLCANTNRPQQVCDVYVILFPRWNTDAQRESQSCPLLDS